MHACVLVHVQTWFKQYYNVSQKSIIIGRIYVDMTWSFHLSGLIFHILFFFFFLEKPFFFNFIYFIYLFLAVLGLRFCAWAFSSCGKRGPLFIAVRGPLTIAAPLVAEHRPPDAQAQ